MSVKPEITIKPHGGGEPKTKQDKIIQFYNLLESIMQFHPEDEICFPLKDIINLDVTNAYLQQLLDQEREEADEGS